MGNTLEKPMGTKPDMKTLEEDQNFKSLTVLNDYCHLCHLPCPDSINFTNNNNCSHIICKSCITNHINSKLDHNAFEIACPVPDCKVLLDPVSCRDIIDQSYNPWQCTIDNDHPYQQWLDRLCYAAIDRWKKCYCPNVNCRALIIDECWGPLSYPYPTKAKCPRCKMRLCFFCRTKWHEGQQCNLSIRREGISLNEMLFNAMNVGEKKKLTRCPTCNAYSELVPRRLGFCIVRCRCETVFCFHCEKEVRRLGCECKEFASEMTNYHGGTMLKLLLLITLLAVASYIWLLPSGNDDYL